MQVRTDVATESALSEPTDSSQMHDGLLPFWPARCAAFSVRLIPGAGYGSVGRCGYVSHCIHFI
jgi:hypothetical protein